MDKKYNREEIDNMPIPQKKEDTVFTDFIIKNKDVIDKIAKSNTRINKSGLTVIPKDDTWLTKTEWDEMYKDLKNNDY